MTGFFAVCLFLVGCVIGAVGHKFFSSNAGSNSKLSKNLDDVSRDFAEYQDKVDAHFKETAELVHNLTQNYVAVHQKLSSGAQLLSRSSLIPLTHETMSGSSVVDTQTAEEPIAPRDYSELDPQKSNASFD